MYDVLYHVLSLITERGVLKSRYVDAVMRTPHWSCKM